MDGVSWQLSAAHADLRPDGLLRWRAAPLRPSDRLDAWLHHLWLAAHPPPGGAIPTRWIALDETLTLPPLADPDAARAELTALLRLMARGLREPLPFFPRSSFV